MKRVYFFAAPSDIVPVLGRVEAKIPLQYVVIENLAVPSRPVFSNSSEIPNPGIATHETGACSIAYLVAPRDADIKIEKFRGSNGEIRWDVSNAGNEHSTILVMAGSWKEMLLPGNMTTLHDTPDAQHIMRRFQSALKAENFARIGMFWVGREAHARFMSGTRLSMTAEQSPPEFDLALGANL